MSRESPHGLYNEVQAKGISPVGLIFGLELSFVETSAYWYQILSFVCSKRGLRNPPLAVSAPQQPSKNITLSSYMLFYSYFADSLLVLKYWAVGLVEVRRRCFTSTKRLPWFWEQKKDSLSVQHLGRPEQDPRFHLVLPNQEWVTTHCQWPDLVWPFILYREQEIRHGDAICM